MSYSAPVMMYINVHQYHYYNTRYVHVIVIQYVHLDVYYIKSVVHVGGRDAMIKLA